MTLVIQLTVNHAIWTRFYGNTDAHRWLWKSSTDVWRSRCHHETVVKEHQSFWLSDPSPVAKRPSIENVGTGETRGDASGADRGQRRLLVEASRSVLVVGVQKHLNGVVLDVGVADHLLGDGLVVRQLFLHLKANATNSLTRCCQTKMVAVHPLSVQNKKH